MEESDPRPAPRCEITPRSHVVLCLRFTFRFFFVTKMKQTKQHANRTRGKKQQTSLKATIADPDAGFHLYFFFYLETRVSG